MRQVSRSVGGVGMREGENGKCQMSVSAVAVVYGFWFWFTFHFSFSSSPKPETLCCKFRERLGLGDSLFIFLLS